MIFLLTLSLGGSKTIVDHGDGTLLHQCWRLHNVIWLGFNKLSQAWVRLLLKKKRFSQGGIELPPIEFQLDTLLTVLKNNYDLLLLKVI